MASFSILLLKPEQDAYQMVGVIPFPLSSGRQQLLEEVGGQGPINKDRVQQWDTE